MDSDIKDLITYVEHVGFAVPDLDQAVAFFVEALGAEELYRSTRIAEGDFMTRTFDAPPESSFTLSMLRFPPSLNVELFQWSGVPRDSTYPRVHDLGGHHLCLHVDDVDQACQRLMSMPGVRQLGEIKTVPELSPLAGTRWVYVITQWGLPIELVNREAVVHPPRYVTPRQVQ